MKVVMIGTGNVATVIAKLLRGAGFEIVQVYGRNMPAAIQLAGEVNASCCSNWKDIERRAELYVAAIADQALYTLGQLLQLEDRLVVHTAGSVSKAVLQTVSSNYGVLYPLQSLRKELAVPVQIPFLVDGSSEAVLSDMFDVARRISDIVVRAGDDERLKFHVAAVVANNFSNHLYAMAEHYCRQENLSFHLLLPLVAETANRIRSISPAQAMTGPAVRGDAVTIQRHLELLQAHPRLQKLYAQMTRSITEANGVKASEQ